MRDLPISSEALKQFCEKHHIQNLSVFGSFAGDSPEEANDIDILVDFIPGREPGLIALAGMEQELSALMNDRPVDMRTPDDLSHYFRDEVVSKAEIQYAAG